MIKSAPRKKAAGSRSKKKEQKVEVVEPKREVAIVPENQPMNVEGLIASAIEKGVPIETMERLIALSERVKASQAKEAYDNAMADLQAELPEIKKTKSVYTDEKVKAYSYAPLEVIIAQVKEPISKHGFSYLIKTVMTKDAQGNVTSVKSVCIPKHRLGHSEESEMEVPLGNKTRMMSPSQVVAAAATFAKRYAFVNAFGIMTGDEDTDGIVKGADQEAPEKEKDPKEQAYDTAMDIIQKAIDDKGLAGIKPKIMKSPKYTAARKKDLEKAIDEKIKLLKEQEKNADPKEPF